MNVASNTSPLIFLGKIGRLDLLSGLFDYVYIPMAVYHEITLNIQDDISHIIHNKVVNKHIEIFKVQNEIAVKTLIGRLHPGEIETIIGAGELKVGRVILDDGYARNKAKHFDLMVTGTLGILIPAYHEGMIKDMQTEIQKLKAVGFRVSNDVIEKVLNLSKE